MELEDISDVSLVSEDKENDLEEGQLLYDPKVTHGMVKGTRSHKGIQRSTSQLEEDILEKNNAKGYHQHP